MAHLGWTDDAVSIRGVCERVSASNARGRPFLVWYGTPLYHLDHGLWYSWGMEEAATSATNVW